ncbi:MAG: hypothetical protein ACO3JL_01670, partial [Myxococcota bacterium]
MSWREMAVRSLSHLGFALLSISALVFCVHVTVGALSLVGKPFPGFTVTKEGFVNPVSLHVWDADRGGLKSWSYIHEVNGMRVSSGAEVWAQAKNVPAGGRLLLRARDVEGEEYLVALPARTFSTADFVKSHTSLSLLGLVFVGVAALLYVLRPVTLEAW